MQRQLQLVRMDTAQPLAPAAAAVIEAGALDCARGARIVVGDLQLRIAAGELIGVFGSNGAGKTTLLQTLAGLLPPAGGSLRLFGGTPAAACRRVGYVAQTMPDGAWGHVAVHSFVAAAWRGERWGIGLRARQARRDAVARALAAVDATALGERSMDQLSGGERQRACIAQALVNPVELLLLDEPLANLDPRAQHALLQRVKRLCVEQELCVLLSAHDINPLLPVMDRVLYLAGGQGRIGSVDSVVNADALSALYGMPIGVARHDGYLFIHPAHGFMAEGAAHCGHHAH